MLESNLSPLFDGFDPVSAEAWRAQIEKDLKGKPYDKVVWRPEPGLEIHPFYTRSANETRASLLNQQPGTGNSLRGSRWNAENPGWQSVQAISLDDVAEARARLSEALASEVSAFSFYSWSGNAEPEALLAVLEGMPLAEMAIHIDAPSRPEAWLNMIEQLDIAPEYLTGTLSFSVEKEFPSAAYLTQAMETGVKFPWFRTLGFDLRFAGEAGLPHSTQLMLALSALADAIAGLEAWSPRQVLEKAAVRFAVGPSFFMETGRLRAWRLLFAQFEHAYGLNEGAYPPFVIAESARWNQSQYDRHTNLLRLTTEGLSAVAGGCQALVLHGFDAVLHPENEQSARFSRNIQHLLRHESYLDAVTDAAGGAYYVEEITEQLAELGWRAFQEMEKSGGFSQSMASGSLRKVLDAAVASRVGQFALRKKVQVGVNQYPNTLETLPDQPGQGPFEAYRSALAYEALRRQADQFGRHTGKRLQAYLFAFGDVAMRGARMLFARDLLGAGGFQVMETSTPNDPATTLTEIGQLQPEVVVLCSSDPEYLESGAAFAREVRAVRPGVLVLLAGRPEGWSEADVQQIYAGMDAPAFLSGLLSRLIPLTV
jgi:methylmalonyl-CoA mutase